jgi:hypothetical protein
MRLLGLVLAAQAAHADVGFLQEGGMGKSSASGLLAKDGGGFAARGAIGGRFEHFGGELMFQNAELGHDDTGYYSALTVGTMFTARHKFLYKPFDRFFGRWFEIYGRIGPTYTWVLADPGTGPMDGASGAGFAAGGGLRFVFAAVCLFADVTVVNVRARSAAEHDPADELGLHDVPAVDVRGHVVTTTFGLGFAL